jgi:hypothetical protein
VELKSARYHILVQSEKAVAFCNLALIQMRDLVLKNGFENQQDEIEFFKKAKPKVYSQLIYHNQIFKIESKRPNSSDKVQRKFLVGELDKIQIFLNDNLEFYQYHRCNSNFLDDHYFIRGKGDIRLRLGNIDFLMDSLFCTNHDQTVACIKAYDILTIYLKQELEKLDSKFGRNEIKEKEEYINESKLNWTETKIALIELIYAIHSTGAVNRGATDIKLLAEAFEQAFHIDLGDIYRSYIEIRARKKERTKFIDYMKESLIHRMDETDQK